jgi:Reverse transcriptase (RNA-dependent DNA polymerase)
MWVSMKIPNINDKNKIKKAEPIKIVNHDAINNYLQKHPINISSNNDSNTNELYDDFSNQLSTIVNKFTKYKTPKPTLYLKPWMSSELISLIHTKDALYKCHKKDPKNTHTKECFTKITNKVTNLRRALKKRYFSKADCTVINPKFCWRLLNEIVYNKIKIKITDIPPKIINPNDQSTITDEHEILNSMNSYFCNVGKAMNDKVKSIPSTNPSTLTENNASMYFPKTNETEILNIIKKLKVNSSPGPDQFQTKLIQKCSSNLIKPLTQISNSMITNGCFPDSTKAAKVIPIFKDGDKFYSSNYRPISVLSVFSKIFENIMLSRILTFLKSQSIISEKQFGFCEKSSTQAATINLLSTLQKRLDSKAKNLGALLFIDLSKAFDSINTLLLIKKCELLGIRGPALKLLTSFLTNRKQFIYNGKTKSDTLANLFGVPQGGLSSPTLFNIFINDIVNLKLKGEIVLYADDICVSYTNTLVDNLKSDMQHDLDVITNWLNFNQLTMNAKKTKFMILSPSKPPTMCNPPLINNVPIEQVNSYKYLGLVIDEQLKWKSHIKHIINKIAPITGVLWRTRHYTSLAMRRKIYFALIHSHLNYLVAIWGNTYKSHLKPLRTIQNKALKIVYNYEWRKNTIELYAQTKILSITNLTFVNMSIFMYQITNNLIKTKIICLKNNQIHKHELRNASDYKIDGYRTHVGAFETSRKASQTFNNLPPMLKEIDNINLFKRLIKKYYVNVQITLDSDQLCARNP